MEQTQFSVAALLVGALLFCAGLQASAQSPVPSPDPIVTGSVPPAARALPADQDALVDADARQARIRRMAGQMLMVTLKGRAPGDADVETAIELVRTGLVGGVALTPANVETARQVKALTGALRQAAAPIGVLVAYDAGGKAVPPVDAADVTTRPEAAVAGDPIAAYSAYLDQARTLHDLGVTIEFDGMDDLHAGPTASGEKAVDGGSMDRALPFARAYLRSHADAGVLTAIRVESANASDPSGDDSASERFAGLLATMPLPMIRVRCPGADSQRPSGAASVRESPGFSGLVVCEALDLAEASRAQKPFESLIRSIEAGSDLVVLSGDAVLDPRLVDRAVDAIAAAVEAGRLPAARIEASYKRILAAKAVPLAAGRVAAASLK